MQLFRKGTESYRGGTQLLTLKSTAWFLLHFKWGTVWELFTILFSPKSDKLRVGRAMLYILKTALLWEILIKAAL